MTEFALVLRIDKVGDREAIKALDDLNAKGRKIVEDVNAATGKALGDIAVAYQRGSAQVKQSLEAIADGHRQNVREMEREAAATDRLGERNAHAIAGASRGIEMLGRTGQLTGRSLDAVVGQISQMAFAFGPAGQIVTAVGISTAAIVEMFMRTSREAKKAADEAVQEFSRIAHADVASQGREASLLYSGDRYNADPLKRFGVKDLKRQQADFASRSMARTSQIDASGSHGVTSLTEDAKEAADALKKVNAELERRNALLASIVGPGGSMEFAAGEAASGDAAGFASRDMKAADRAAKQAMAEAKRRAKEMAREAEAYQKELLSDARDAAAQLVKDARFHDEFIDGLLGLPSKADQKQAFHDALFELGANIRESIATDPFLNFRKGVKELSKQLGDIMKSGLADSLVSALDAGFEKAFSGSGAVGFLEGFGKAMLTALGGIMEQMGAALLQYGIAMELVAVGLTNPFTSGPAAIAAGSLLIGLGAALKAATHGGAGGSSGASSAASVGGTAPMDFVSFGMPAQAPITTTGSAPTALPAMTFNLFGADSPTVQRGIAEIVNKAANRGLIPSLAA